VTRATAHETVKYFNAQKKHVVTIGGYSAAEYQRPKTELREIIRKYLSKFDPTTTIINGGATGDGIGDLGYSVAKEMGFRTTGIISSEAYTNGTPKFSALVDEVFVIDDPTWGGFRPGTRELSPTSSALVRSSNEMFNVGGGAIAGDESVGMIRLGKKVNFTPAEMNHAIAIKKAADKNLPIPTTFRGAAHEVLMGTTDEIPSGKVITPIRGEHAPHVTKDCQIPKSGVLSNVSKRAIRIAGAAAVAVSAISVAIPKYNPFMKVVGLDCDDLEKASGRIRCENDSEINPFNSWVICTEILGFWNIEGTDRCAAATQVYSFQAEDAGLKKRLNDRGYFSQNGHSTRSEKPGWKFADDLGGLAEDLESKRMTYPLGDDPNFNENEPIT
jgi:hypothetical protein